MATQKKRSDAGRVIHSVEDISLCDGGTLLHGKRWTMKQSDCQTSSFCSIVQDFCLKASTKWA